MSPLRHEDDLRPAEAVAKLLDAKGDKVTSVIPPGYESYVRVLNPIELRDGSTVSWTDVVSSNGVRPRAWMQWPEFAADEEVVLPDGYWREPDMGNPPVSLATRLIEALEPDRSIHYFASWAGYAAEIEGPTVMFSPYQREMVLYTGSLVDENRARLLPTTATGRVPMYWWPSDLAGSSVRTSTREASSSAVPRAQRRRSSRIRILMRTPSGPQIPSSTRSSDGTASRSFRTRTIQPTSTP